MNRATAPDNITMKQQDLGLNLNKRRTRKAVFLDEMNLVVPWAELLALIAPHAPRAKTGRAPFELETMLRIHFVQQWFGLSDLAMEEALFETALHREFVGLRSVEHIPDRVSIQRFRHLQEEHQLAAGQRQRHAHRQGTDAARGHGGGRHPDCRTQLDQEQGRRTRPRDAPDQQGKSVALRYEGAGGFKSEAQHCAQWMEVEG